MDKLQPINLPPLLKARPSRPPQANIPQTAAERSRLRELVEWYAPSVEQVPPVALEDLRVLTGELIAEHGLNPSWQDYLAVLLNNALWREALAEVPFNRRLLLLPKCLRDEDRCPAPFDELGLLCKDCGLCSIEDLQGEAERLGYAVLVAEGSALVMAMIQSGQVEAIVGVSCFSVLEKAFPHTESAAIPSVAIPLLQDDCKNVNVDLDWVWNVIHLSSEDRTRRLDLDQLKSEVSTWFEPTALAALIGDDQTSLRLATDWLGRAGKRWRPFLAACCYKALAEDPDASLPDDLQQICVAVECFHKASLIHDDIEDDDDQRYGEEAMHVSEGVPVALNVGDLLVGEGYRLLAETTHGRELTRHAAAGHRTLCLGQGAELVWARDPRPLSINQVLEIYRQKTAPAFEVALQLGALRAGAGPEVMSVLARYSEALGIAYQIRDDLDDLSHENGLDDLTQLRPTLLLAIAHDKARGAEKALVASAWRREAVSIEELRRLMDRQGVESRANELLESFKREAVVSLNELKHASLKGLLRRVIGKIFQLEVKGWCSEFEARNAAGRAPGAQAAGGIQPAGHTVRSKPAD